MATLYFAIYTTAVAWSDLWSTLAGTPEGTGTITGSGSLLGVGESPVVIPLPTNVRWTNVAGTSMNLEWDAAA